MNSKRIYLLLLTLLILGAAGWGLIDQAQAGPGQVESATNSYQLAWWTVAGGGGSLSSASGSYKLHATVGQAQAGLLVTSQYTLAGGFWTSPAPPTGWLSLFLPMICR
jgi:hypothetical protein